MPYIPLKSGSTASVIQPKAYGGYTPLKSSPTPSPTTTRSSNSGVKFSDVLKELQGLLSLGKLIFNAPIEATKTIHSMLNTPFFAPKVESSAYQVAQAAKDLDPNDPQYEQKKEQILKDLGTIHDFTNTTFQPLQKTPTQFLGNIGESALLGLPIGELEGLKGLKLAQAVKRGGAIGSLFGGAQAAQEEHPNVGKTIEDVLSNTVFGAGLEPIGSAIFKNAKTPLSEFFKGKVPESLLLEPAAQSLGELKAPVQVNAINNQIGNTQEKLDLLNKLGLQKSLQTERPNIPQVFSGLKLTSKETNKVSQPDLINNLIETFKNPEAKAQKALAYSGETKYATPKDVKALIDAQFPTSKTSKVNNVIKEKELKLNDLLTKKQHLESIDPNLKFEDWKDKAAISLARENFDRNVDVVAGKDAPKVKQLVSNPIKENEFNRIQFVNKARQEARDFVVKDLGIRVRSKEDKLVQRFGENKINLENLKKETKNWKQVTQAADYFRNLYDDLLDRVNQARKTNGYEPIPKRQDYFRHFQEMGNLIENFGGMVKKESELPTEISGLTNIFKPGKPFTTAEMRRVGGKYTESAIAGFDEYLNSITKQIFHIDSVQRVRALENLIRKQIGSSNNPRKLSTFVANLGEYGNLLAGKGSKIDTAVQSVFGRKIFQVISKIQKRVSANMISANIGSALTNFIPFTQAAATTSKPALARGLLETVISPFTSDFSEIAGQESKFLVRRYPVDRIDFTKVQKVENLANWIFQSIDRFSARSIVAGKYFESVSKGLSPEAAIQAADDYGAKVMADRSFGQLPNIMGTRTLGVFTQFQTEVNNMYSFITKDIPQLSGGNKIKTTNAIAQFLVYSFAFNTVFEQVVGRRPTIDPIYALGTVLGVTPDGENKDLSSRLGKASSDIAGNLPFIGGVTGGRLPVQAAIPQANTAKEWEKLLYFLGFPFGGLQAKKSVEGLGSYLNGVATSSGKVKFSPQKNQQNLLRSLLFGSSSTPEARKYYQRLK